MLSWSHSPFTNWRIGDPNPGTAVALYEFVRSKLYSVGLNRTVMILFLSAPSRTVMVAFCSWGLLMASNPSAFAFDARVALHAADHVFGDPLHEGGVGRYAGDWIALCERRRAGGHRSGESRPDRRGRT